MKVYEDYSRVIDEFSVDTILELNNDGSFSYRELWRCYAGSSGFSARGTWRKSENKIIFFCEESEAPLSSDWRKCSTITVFERNGSILLDGNVELSLIRDDGATFEKVENEETAA